MLVVSHSELDAYRQCPHKHDLGFKQRWVPSVVGGALGKGLLWHRVMEVHYGCIKDETTHRHRMQKIARLLIEHSDEEVGNLIGWMYDGYVERWGMDEQWEILSIEDGSIVELPRPTPFAKRVGVRMRIDLMVKDRFLGGKTWVVDHKSGQNLPTEKELDIDDQFGLYTWGKRHLGVPVFGAWYSAAVTRRNKVKFQQLDERFDRKRLYRTDTELDTIAREAYDTARNAYSNRPAPRAPDSERCRWRCPFTEPCLAGRKGMPEVDYLKAARFKKMSEAEHLAYRGYAAPDHERKEE